MTTWQAKDELGAYQIKINRTGKTRISLRVKAVDFITISAPKHVSQLKIQAFINQHQTWITQQRQQLSTQANTLGFWFQGQYIDCSHSAQEHAQHLPYCIDDIYDFLQDQSQRILLPRLDELLRQIQPTHCLDLRLANVRGYWGVCRPQQIKLNWRLIGAPDFVVDYVCWHEIAHLTHANHSKQFWNLVAQYYPEYLSAKYWLKAHGSELMAVDQFKRN